MAEYRAKAASRVVWWRDTVCVYCGCPGVGADHIIPKSKGGPDIRENLVWCCQPCNNHKANRLDVEMMRRAFRHIEAQGGCLDWIELGYPKIWKLLGF